MSHSFSARSLSDPSRPNAAGSRILARGQARHSYSVRLARTEEELHAAQMLRFLVFNVEMNEGLEASYRTCRDEDPFDGVCDHLLVEVEGEVVGTYRLQTGVNALLHRGYYSEQEFDFAPYESVRHEIVELGRACVARAHRNLIVLGLLWRGIAAYSREHCCRYLIGCGSLNSRDESEGAALHARFSASHAAPAEWQTRPLPSYHCRLDAVAGHALKVPKLLSAYLSLGAKICAPPAIDREFRTIDFLTLLDLESLPAAAKRVLA